MMKKLRCKSEIKKMAGAAAVTLGALGFYFLAPSGYIALDLNPSIEIRTNRLDQVVSVKAVNEDAKRLLADYKVTDHDLEDVLEDMVDLLDGGGYFHNKDQNDILVTVKDDKASDETVKRVNAFLEDYMEQCQLDTRILDQTIDFDREIRKAAEKYEVSQGKMALIERLLAGDQDLTAGTWPVCGSAACCCMHRNTVSLWISWRTGWTTPTTTTGMPVWRHWRTR
ncbi:hypothetical protein [Enterocloster asparagiformis]|uniref:anti-sigma-I factor RsgI family protein n=1 Tax=Enterocloster asparagiformis TaxID=333367 RepID=UPI0004B76C23|nr:hypothetical protein [Enterocloster asparagiformis]